MSKYLLARTQCDDLNAGAPDLYVLSLTHDRVAQLARLVRFVQDAREHRISLKAIEFAFGSGDWMVTGDSVWINQTVGDNNAVVRDGDFMAIVGEGVLDERLIVEPSGEISFRCIHNESDMYIWARSINIQDLERALAVPS